MSRFPGTEAIGNGRSMVSARAEQDAKETLVRILALEPGPRSGHNDMMAERLEDWQAGTPSRPSY